MKIALLSAAVNGDNAGDAMIEDGVRRIVDAQEFIRFPLLRPLTPDEIFRINQTDCVIICGTNLYQKVFACSLDTSTIKKIKVPIIPIGIGSSAPIGQIPKMKWLHARRVRLLHSRCKMGSVRDPATAQFLKSIGVKNFTLTGCSVLFHSQEVPRFDGSGEGLTLSLRARLLHSNDKSLWDKEASSVEVLCKRYSPLLIAQSPYDLEFGEHLSRKYSLKLSYDNEWQASLYVDLAKKQRKTLGFRLHYGMLSLSYGKPAYVIAHDSRSASFCDLMNMKFYDIKTFVVDEIESDIDKLEFNGASFCKRWTELAQTMTHFLEENGLRSKIKS